MFMRIKNRLNRLAKDYIRAQGPDASDFHGRIRLAHQCRDSDVIPKISDAGTYKMVNGEKVLVMHNGVVVASQGYCGQWMDDLIIGLKGCHEPQEEKVFHELLKHIPDDATMLECGCYWAYYSLWFLHGKPKRKAFLYEPSDEYAKVAKKNLALNNQDVTVERGYINDHDTNEPFFDENTNAYVQIPGISIDGFMKQKNLSHLNIVHSDIQGAETAMLRGGKETFSNHRVDYIVISTHGEEHEKCLALLDVYKYRIIAEHSIDQSYSTDGLIVAASPKAPWFEKIHIKSRWPLLHMLGLA